MSAKILRRRGVRRTVIPVAAILVSLLFLAYNTSLASQGSHATFAFQTYWPSPASYVPGTGPPVAYLQINYTSSGEGSYSYLITYNTTSGIAKAGGGQAIVSQGAPFRAYVYIPVSSNETVVARAVVYSGQNSDQIVFSQTLNL